MGYKKNLRYKISRRGSRVSRRKHKRNSRKHSKVSRKKHKRHSRKHSRVSRRKHKRHSRKRRAGMHPFYKFNWGGKAYAIKSTDETNPKIGEIYDLKSYKVAREKNDNSLLKKLGRTRVNSNTGQIEFLSVDNPHF